VVGVLLFIVGEQFGEREYSKSFGVLFIVLSMKL
jgi:hypothetical protein